MSNTVTAFSAIRISDLASAVFGSRCSTRIIGVIAAYFDDSGTDRKYPVLVMGGAIATVENWKAFEDEWRAILEENHIDCFHMTDFDNKWGQFHPTKFCEEHRIPLISNLLAVIKKRIQAMVIIGVNKQDYADVEGFYGIKIYPFTAFECLSGVAQWADEVQYDGPIAYIFDQGGGSKELGGKGTLDVLRTALVKDASFLAKFRMTQVESWSYGYMKTLLPLQAADVVAYEAWKELQNDFSAGRRIRWRESAKKLIFRERVYQAYFGAEEFAMNDSRWMNRVQHFMREGI